MKSILNNLKSFFEFKLIDKENVFVISSFYLKDSNSVYPIYIKKIDDESYIIHDAGSIVYFLDENDFQIDKELILELSKEYSNLEFTNNNEIVYKTKEKLILNDIAKFIQIITKIAG